MAEVPFGKGKILFCTVAYAQDISGNALLFCWQRALKEELARHFPVKASHPGPDLCCNRTEKGFLIGTFNNVSAPWEGEIEVDGVKKQISLAPFEAQIWRCESKKWELEYTVDC